MLDFSSFQPKINFSNFQCKTILKLFFGVKGVTSSENGRNISNSLLMFYFIVKHIKGGTDY